MRDLEPENPCLTQYIGALALDNKHKSQVLHEVKSLEDSVNLKRKLEKCSSQSLKLMEGALETSGVGVVNLFSEKYPALLREIYDPPLVLFYRGDISILKRFRDRSIAIVGSRKASERGKLLAAHLGSEFQRLGLSVVSGLALGIDGMAHRGALESAKTNLGSSFPGVSVLAGGVNRVYPSKHVSLAEGIVEAGGLVVSEYLPTEAPRKHRFPARNRIIAGLCQATILVEGRARSGARITARLANEAGRDVYVVPGRIDDIEAEAALDLLAMGSAYPLRQVEDALASYPGILRKRTNSKQKIRTSINSGKPKGSEARTETTPRDELCKLIEKETKLHFEELSLMSSLSPEQVGIELGVLELEGRVFRLSGDYYTVHKLLLAG